MKFGTEKLADLGYGDITNEGATVDLSENVVAELAEIISNASENLTADELRAEIMTAAV